MCIAFSYIETVVVDDRRFANNCVEKKIKKKENKKNN